MRNGGVKVGEPRGVCRVEQLENYFGLEGVLRGGVH